MNSIANRKGIKFSHYPGLLGIVLVKADVESVSKFHEYYLGNQVEKFILGQAKESYKNPYLNLLWQYQGHL